jgi:hypothetical protein
MGKKKNTSTIADAPLRRRLKTRNMKKSYGAFTLNW